MTDLNQISIEKIKKWFAKIRRGKSSYGKDGIKPKNDWNLMIIIATITFCLEILIACFIYSKIESGVLFNQPENTVQSYVFLDQNLLQKITSQIDTKAAYYSATSTNKTVDDPSL
jgi:hypothetical protein